MRRLNHGVWMVALVAALVCSGCGALGQSGELYLPNLLSQASNYNGKDVTVDGTYVRRGTSNGVLAFATSTLDNGLDAQPVGEPVWLEGFPEEQVKDKLHQPGDALYGFVRVTGRFDTAGGYGPDKNYKYRIQVTQAESIEQVRRNEVRISNQSLGDGKVSLFELVDNGAAHNDQKVVTQGYYFWNGPLAVLAEGVSTELDGSSPQPVGKQIWMEGFPPDKSAELNVGPNNSFVWGKVEITGAFKSGGGFGKDGAYAQFLQAESATVLK